AQGAELGKWRQRALHREVSRKTGEWNLIPEGAGRGLSDLRAQNGPVGCVVDIQAVLLLQEFRCQRVIGIEGRGAPPVTAIGDVRNIHHQIAQDFALHPDTPLHLARRPASVVVGYARRAGECTWGREQVWPKIWPGDR